MTQTTLLKHKIHHADPDIMPEGISVVICTFNGVTRLQPTLEHLLNQTNVCPSKWEVIVVDNASTDNTGEFVKDIWEKHQLSNKPEFKLVTEHTPGVSAARVKGINEARFKYVLFCDDDNWLKENYISLALKIMQDNTDIGILGGMGSPVFEGQEPPYFWTNQYHTLAVGPQYRMEGDITENRGVVYGAGMVLNKAAFMDLIENYNFTFQSTGRIGNSLASSEDQELCLALKLIGYRVFWHKNLKFQHYIPINRTTIDYYKRLFEGFGMSYPLLLGYSLNKKNANSIKNDYRYIALRNIKNLLKLNVSLFLSGYFFKKNKYKHLDHLYSLYHNWGSLKATIRFKNKVRDQFLKTKLFLDTDKL